jgi:hypothetical protein
VLPVSVLKEIETEYKATGVYSKLLFAVFAKFMVAIQLFSGLVEQQIVNTQINRLVC